MASPMMHSQERLCRNNYASRRTPGRKRETLCARRWCWCTGDSAVVLPVRAIGFEALPICDKAMTDKSCMPIMILTFSVDTDVFTAGGLFRRIPFYMLRDLRLSVPVPSGVSWAQSIRVLFSFASAKLLAVYIL